MTTDPADLRRDYTLAGLDRADLHADPVSQFRLWFEQAQSAQLIEPNAMTLATVDSQGCPNARTVLLKAYDHRGFVFYTNYESQKALELAANPHAAALFAWLPLERQVKLRGRTERVSTAESLRYFLSRPSGSRLGAWVSQQSKVITNRGLLEMKLEEMKQKFSHGEIPLPDFWGGIRIVPTEFEFWQGRQNRLHDRFRYRLDHHATDNGNGEDAENNVHRKPNPARAEKPSWVIERLSP